LFREPPHTVSLKETARDACFTKSALVAVGKIARVRDYLGIWANAAEPAIGLSPGGPGTAKIGEDYIGLELVRQFRTEHDVGGLSDHANTRDRIQPFGEQLWYASMLVDDQDGYFVIAFHVTRLGRVRGWT
jgi:hypothetical protein